MFRQALALTALMAIAGCMTNAQPVSTPPSQAQPAQSQPESPRYNCETDQMGDQALVGRTEQEAAELLNGCRWRVVERDGQSLPGTMDYAPERRNLAIRNGKVIWVRRG